MKSVRNIQAIDSHTMGEPTRIIIGGIPKVPGDTMAAKKIYLEEHLDHLRTAIMLEPRGHSDMFGSIITEPCNKEADFGIIFMDCGGYLNMCGHGSIGAMTVAVETGMVQAVEPVTTILLDTPAGLVRGEVRVENGRAREVSIVNVPSFLYRSGELVDLPGVGPTPVDIAFGGNFFILVAAERLGLEVTPRDLPRLRALALELREIVNRTVPIRHPLLPHIRSADLVEVYGPGVDPRARFRNVVVFGNGNVDRSPCGTGTSAKMAALHAKGQLAVDEDFVYESILGTLFRGRILEEVQAGDLEAIVPRITGSAYITGFNHFIIDEEDPLKFGFAL
jgi:proline racemase